MKNITRFAVNYPVTITMLVFGVLLLGYISLKNLTLDLFPEMEAPRIFVELNVGERPPEEIEKQFIKDIESLIIRQKGVRQVSSVCLVGTARLTTEYSWGTDMDEAFLDLQKGLAAFSQNPDIDELTISQHDPNASPVIIYAMENPEITDMNELRIIGENFLRNELIRLEGIADVKLSGIEEKEVIIETNPTLLEAFKITTGEIAAQIQNMNRSISGGSIEEMGKKYIIKGTGLLNRVSDFENLIIGYRQPATEENTQVQQASSGNLNKVPVMLRQVATVSIKNKEPENIIRINGKRCVGLSIYKETGYNTVKALSNLEERMANIAKTLPGYSFTIIKDQGNYIKQSIDEVKHAAILGAIIAIIVLFLFLRSLGITLVVSVAIPVSVVATFNLMYFNHLSLNIMTLGGLALGAGMLVDNAIVVMENIFRNLEKGLSVREAAIQGTAEVGGAITASTLTTIVVFLPIVYLQGASATLFKDQAWTVAFSLLASLFVAILFIPMFFHVLYKNSPKKLHLKSIQISWYGRILDNILNKRIWILLAALILIGLSALVVPRIGSEYLPKGRTGEFSINITLPEGTQLERTHAAATGIETMLHDLLDERIKTVYSEIGPVNANPSKKQQFENENTASIHVALNDAYLKNTDYIIQTVHQELQGISGMQVAIIKDETALQATLGTDEAPLSIEVQGNDLEELERITTDIKVRLMENPLLTNLKTSIEAGAPEVDLVIDRYKASLYNLNAESITNQIKNQLMGNEVGKFDQAGELKTITIKMPDRYLSNLPEMKIQSGNLEVPLYEIASIEYSSAPRELHRHNQNRVAMVTANIESKESFNKVINKVRADIGEIELPADYNLTITGEEQKRKEAMSNLGFALVLSVVLVYMVMAAQFESLIHPFTILLTIPLAGVGTVWAFYLLGKPFNMMAYIGIIMLGGIAVNDSIILVDFINQLKAAGYSLRESIVRAGENRIRPIIMTSLTTILALFPLTLGFGESAELRSSMAIAVIAGLVTSTLLTLVVIPCVYYLFDRSETSSNTRP